MLRTLPRSTPLYLTGAFRLNPATDSSMMARYRSYFCWKAPPEASHNTAPISAAPSTSTKAPTSV